MIRANVYGGKIDNDFDQKVMDHLSDYYLKDGLDFVNKKGILC